MKFKVIALFSAISLCSCTSSLGLNGESLHGSKINFGNGGQGLFAVADTDNEGLSELNLLAEIDPANRGGWRTPTPVEDGVWRADTYCNQLDTASHGELSFDEQLACALEGFYHSYETENFEFSQGAKRRPIKPGTNEWPENFFDASFQRNRIQDRIIAASNQACDSYRRHLLATQSDANYLYGNAISLTAGLAAIFTDPATTRGLAGSSAILGASRAEYNSGYFRKLLAEVITRGITEERDTVFVSIKSNQKLDIFKYTLEAAISDAVQYNAKCTMISGLENAQKSQSFYSDPGLDRLAYLLVGGEEDRNVSELYAVLSELREPSETDAADEEEGAEEISSPLEGIPTEGNNN